MPEGKPPHFPQQPVARQNEDGSIELECFFEAQPQADIKWFYEANELSDGGRFSMRLDNKGTDSFSAILQMKELADADAGAYKCAISNPHGKGNANFNLKLTGFDAPTFEEKPAISSKDEGQTLVLEFKARSKSAPTPSWTREGAVVPESDRVKLGFQDLGNQVYHCFMEIKEPTKDKDAGQYICTVTNESGKMTATFTVKFEVPPGAPVFVGKPQILQKTLESGDPAIIMEVRFQADFQPAVTWLNPKGKKMKESSRIRFVFVTEQEKQYLAQLELKNYKAKDSGTYLCNIKNEAGEANVEMTVNIEGPTEE
jgi:hypothetical protein